MEKLIKILLSMICLTALTLYGEKQKVEQNQKIQYILEKYEDKSDEEKYDKSFETNLGEIRYPSFYEMMLDKDNLIDYLPNSYGLYLKSEAGIITPQVKLLEIEY